MRKSKIDGKCKTCLGCNKLDEIGFRGITECKYYINDKKDNFKVILIIVFEILILLLMGYFVYLKMSNRVGG